MAAAPHRHAAPARRLRGHPKQDFDRSSDLHRHENRARRFLCLGHVERFVDPVDGERCVISLRTSIRPLAIMSSTCPCSGRPSHTAKLAEGISVISLIWMRCHSSGIDTGPLSNPPTITTRPPRRAISVAWGSVSGIAEPPEHSNATSTPRPPVHSITRATASSRALFTTSSAPSSRARSSALSTTSVMSTSAPVALASIICPSPIGPAPSTATRSLTFSAAKCCAWEAHRESVDQRRFLEADMVGEPVEFLGGPDHMLGIGLRHAFGARRIEVGAAVVLLDAAPFAPAAAEHALDDHAIARADVGHGRADLHHLARQFVAHDVAFEFGLVLLPVPEVGPADSCDADPDLDPIGRRKLKIRHFLDDDLPSTSLRAAFIGTRKPSCTGRSYARARRGFRSLTSISTIAAARNRPPHRHAAPARGLYILLSM